MLQLERVNKVCDLGNLAVAYIVIGPLNHVKTEHFSAKEKVTENGN